MNTLTQTANLHELRRAMAQATEKLHAVQRARAAAIKNNPAEVSKLTRRMIFADRMHQACVREYERVIRLSARREAAE